MPPQVGGSSIAVCYAGLMSVNLPERGATARQHLVDVLGADVFLAGTFFTTGKLATKCKRKCLLGKASGLAPFTATRLDPMLSRRQLLGRIQQTPHWEQIKRNFTWAPHGLTIWAPVLGNPTLSVLREQHDLSRVLDLLESHERSRAFRYQRVVWSRLEFDWLAHHPPLDVLPTGIIHVPPDASMSDRHAVMDRSAADIYFRRWELLQSAELPNIIPSEILLKGSPEYLLLALIQTRRQRVATFPPTMVIPCCLSHLVPCFMPFSCKSVGASSSSVAVRANEGASGSRPIKGKYHMELSLAVPHAAALTSGHAEYVSSGLKIRRARRWDPRAIQVGVRLKMRRADALHLDQALNDSRFRVAASPWVDLVD
jgi:hypothetical protein